MTNTKTIVLCLFVTFLFATFSCAKKQQGSVVFWVNNSFTSSGLGAIDVVMEDATNGTISIGDSTVPACNANGRYTYTITPGTYSFHAKSTATDGNGNPLKTWSGSVIINSGQCGNQKLTIGTPVNDTLNLLDSQNQPLNNQAGGYVYITSNGVNIIVARVNGGGATPFIALSSACTKDQCTIAYSTSNNNLQCPCCLSIYNTDGSVVSGPAPLPLTKYNVTINGNTLIISL